MNIALKNRLLGLHKASVYAMVVMAFLCVVVGGGVGAVLGTVFVVGAVASWFVDRAQMLDPERARRWGNALVVVFIAVSAAHLLTTEAGAIYAAIRFVLLLALFKLFVRFEPRDDLQIYALTLLLFAAATAIHEGVTYGVLFGLYVLAGTLSLALFHLRVESSQQQVADEVDSNPFDRRYATVLAALSLVIFASSMLIFFAFPRVGMGFFMSQSRDRQSVSGFNDSVELGDHGSIRDNPQVVMRVEFPEGRPDDYQSLHWRAMTFDDYDGERWSQSLEDTDEEALPSRRNIFEFDERHEEFHPDFSRDTDPMPVEIYLEPLGTNIMPRLWPTDEVILGQEEVHIHWDPNKGEITSDVYGDLRHTVESDVGVAYNQSVLGEPDPERLREQQVSGASDMPGDNYLELPEVSGSFEELADEVTAGAETPYEKAEAVSEHLESNYEYTTDLPELGSKAPVEEFLFETERGHCEYFASAAALLLREAEVPTRVVNGFLGGSWNSVGEYLTVRQGDAHSWIEVYVPNFGWTPVDPTPAADVLPVEPGPLEQWLRDTSDTVRMTWMKWVIEYDLQSQIDLFERVGKMLAPRERGASNGDTGGDDRESDEEDGLEAGTIVFWLGLVSGAIIAFVVARRGSARRDLIAMIGAPFLFPGLLAVWVMWFYGFTPRWGVAGALLGAASVALGLWLGRLGSRTRHAQITKHFELVERAARRAGMERADDESPSAFLKRLQERFPRAKTDLATFRQRYLSARFGPRRPTPAQVTGMRRLVGRIRGAIKDAA